MPYTTGFYYKKKIKKNTSWRAKLEKNKTKTTKQKKKKKHFMDSWPTPKSKVLQNRKSFCSQCVCVFFQIWNPQDSQNIRQLVFLVLVFYVFCTYKYSNVRPVDLEFVRLRETAFGNLNVFGLSSSVCVCPWTLLH